MKYKIPKIGMSIKARLFVAISLPILSLVSIAGWWVLEQEKISQQFEVIITESLPLALATENLKLSVTQIQQWLTDISATRGRDGLDDGFTQAEEHHQKFLEVTTMIKKVLNNELDGSDLDDLNQIIDAEAEYYQVGQKMAHAYVDGGTDAGNRTMAEFDGAAERLKAALDPFTVKFTKMAQSDLQTSVNDMQQFTRVLLVVTALIGFITFFIAWVTVASITGAIRRLCSTFAGIAESRNLNSKFEIVGNDELTTVMRSFSTLVQAMQQTVRRISEIGAGLSASTVMQSSTAAGMTQTVQRIVIDNERSAAAIHQSSASIQEFSSTTEEITKKMRLIKEKSSAITKAAQDASHVVKQSEEAMLQIETSSREISKITGVITEISNQTNLLSLNAAIEAAKAGEFGKGFAVVAEEVKLLAERSREAITEIMQRIERSVVAVNQGNQITANTANLLGDIISMIENIDEEIQAVSSAVAEQEQGIGEMAQAAEEISSTTDFHVSALRDLTSATEDTEKMSQGQSTMASTLLNIVMEFQGAR